MARCSPQVRRLASRHSGSINFTFTYWFVFLCTRYAAAALFSAQSSRYGTITNINIHNISILRIAIRSLRNGEWFCLDLIPKMRLCTTSDYTSMKIKKYGASYPPSTLNNTPTEMERQCTAINFGIVRRYCGVFDVWGIDIITIRDGIWGKKVHTYLLQFSFLLHPYWCIITWGDVPKRYICIDTNVRQNWKHRRDSIRTRSKIEIHWKRKNQSVPNVTTNDSKGVSSYRIDGRWDCCFECGATTLRWQQGIRDIVPSSRRYEGTGS